MAKSDHSDREKAERINRLRERLEGAKRDGTRGPMVGIIAGILDLLADEL